MWPSPSPSLTFATGTVMGLSERADTVHFIVRRNAPGDAGSILKRTFGWEFPANLSIHLGPGKGLINTRWFFYRYAYKTIRTLVASGQLDAVITRSIPFLPYLVALKRKCGIPVFYESHDYFADPDVRGNGSIAKRNRRLELTNIPHIDGILCLMEQQRALYRRSFPGTASVVARTGIHRLLGGNNGAGTDIGYIGSLDRHKGVETLFRAAAASKTRPRLIIAGGKTQDEIAACRALAAELYDGEKVHVTGWMDKEDLNRQIRRMKAGIIPLRDTFFNRNLTSPLKLFDYFAAGIPVISADLPTTRELIRETGTGFFYPPGDAAALAGAIDALYGMDADVYAAVCRNVRSAAQELLWSRRAETILSFVGKTGNAGTML